MLLPFHDDNPTRGTPWATYTIIAINLLAFLWLLQLPAPRQQELFFTSGFVPARLTNLDNPRPIPIAGQPGLALAPMDRQQVLWSLVTCMFLHGGWLHLIGNMWFLWIFGDNVEDRLGGIVFLIFYLVGGILASLCHWMIVRGSPAATMPVVGASGAVATILGAYAISWPWARIHTLVFLFIFITVIDLPALLVLGVWFLGQLLSIAAADQELVNNVAWWAHIGGFVSGMIAMPLLSNLLGVPHGDAGDFADVEVVDEYR
jgi:membrane associated rhomboid family serine protease